MKYKRIKVDDYTMFYRECGDITKPVFLYSCIPVLHGFPSASHMFRNLMPLLENTFYCIAPDYIGFAHPFVPPRGTTPQGPQPQQRRCIVSIQKPLISRFPFPSIQDCAILLYIP